MRTYVPLSGLSPSKEFESSKGPILGRLILLFAAYAPVVVIIGLRGIPADLAWSALGLGILGVIVWIWFLRWLPHRQARDVNVKGAHYIDAEVTGYIVSLLLPVVATSSSALNDWLAYLICGALILLVAFSAELWSVNPITYAFGMRAARAIVDDEPRVILLRGALLEDGPRLAVRRIGVTYVLESASGAEDSLSHPKGAE